MTTTKRHLIIGGVAGGASTAARLRRLDEQAEIIMFERGPHVSFSNCCLPWHLSGTIADADTLVLMSPEQFWAQYRITARTGHEVIAISPAEKTITVKDVATGEATTEAYDTLTLSPGAAAIRPQIPGIDTNHVFTIRNVVDIDALQRHLVAKDAKEVVVVGAGFVGLEVAENLVHGGRKVTIIEALPQVLSPLDPELAAILHKELVDQGVDLHLGDSLVEIRNDEVELASGTVVKAEAVVMSVGVRPETALAKAAGLEIGTTGGIKVDENFRTSDPYIYAVGDAIEVTHRLTGKPSLLAMAGPAQRQARTAADHIYGRPTRNRGVIGSSVVQVFDYTAASTGLNEKQAKEAGVDYDFVYVIPGDSVGIMPDSKPLFFKLLFEKPTGRVLGAQAVGKGAADKRIDIIATLITMNGTLEDLADTELAYSPLYSTAKDVVIHAALVGQNILNGEFEQVPVTKVRELVESGAFIIDAREPDEYAAGHIRTAVNIPLSQFRDRLSEIPTDRPVYVHCRSSQRSYNQVRALGQLGVGNAVNISGSYLGICMEQWFEDQASNREPIVTEYNFA
ncbi:FAD-dependent oxidoreductase [Brachybacterium timonense]|uniref:FAD-dependent oxidoreductase n=1 Tax=Brachybacterium timonense TaxID=2050896 RepID=UPI000D0B1D92|nr:FAD-dependent oxidoreductase [Brachybacterium timonense]